jgi:predicted ATPase/DNA-binding SARP family transcriptional activator
VLGAIEVEIDGVDVALGGPTPRRLLAALSTMAGRSMSDDLLAELLWGDDQPTDVPAALRVIVHRLRQTLGPNGRQVVQRTTSGYALMISPEQTDHGRFDELVSAGNHELQTGAADRAVKSFEAALSLWRGQPWAELGEAVQISGGRNRLVELREVAIEELQAARLACGDTARAVATLSEAVTEAPYRERRWELLALGLYRSGRQSHALAELRKARELLAEEMGIEPGPELRELEQRMLEQDPGLLLGHSAGRSGQQLMHTPRPSGVIVAPSTAMFGRDHELDRLKNLLEGRRLVTIVGPPGVGKTRLAIEHAATESDCWLVRLADVHAAQSIAPSIAAALGLTYVAWDPVLAIQRAISDRRGLLVLDNCEHLTEPVAELVVTMLSSCPELRILATSRRALDVDGEYALTLDPLPEGPAVALLMDRVRTNRTDWHPSTTDHAAARDICATLEGLPLAIELAAARERVFGLREIAVHLQDRLDVLGHTPHGSISPHASLDAAIGWSVDQLPYPDRSLLLRLWPFEGGFTWQAAESVHSGSGDTAVLVTLAALVNRSVLVADVSSGRPRYRMLEIIRRYCQSADPAPAETREAHARWVRSYSAEHGSLLTGSRSAEAFRALQAELANIRSGILHDLEHHPEHALRTTGVLGFMWVTIGAIPEGIRWINAALAACPGASATDRARALVALSIASFHAGDSGEAVRLAQEAIQLLDGTPDPDPALLLEAHSRVCNALAFHGDPVALREASMRFKFEADRRATPGYLRACALFGIGIVELQDGDVATATETFAEARRLSEECGFVWGEGIAEGLLAWGTLMLPERTRSTMLAVLQGLARAVDAFERQPNVSDTLSALYSGAFALAELGEHDVASQLRAAVLEHAARVGTDPRRYAVADIEERLSELLGDAPAGGGVVMEWPAMVALFTDTVTAVTALKSGSP